MDAMVITGRLCSNCGKYLYYDKKTELLKYKNGQCRRIYTLTGFKRKDAAKVMAIKRKGTSRYFKTR